MFHYRYALVGSDSLDGKIEFSETFLVANLSNSLETENWRQNKNE